MKGEVSERVKMLTNTELNDVNLVRAINTKVIPIAAYPMNVCKFNGGELKELDQVIKRFTKLFYQIMKSRPTPTFYYQQDRTRQESF